MIIIHTEDGRLTMRLGAGLIVLGAVLFGCTSDVTRARDASLNAARAFAKTAPLLDRQTMAGASSNHVALYVDASRSMAGFVGCDGAATPYDIVLDRITTELAIDSVFRFGQVVGSSAAGTTRQALDRAIHCAPFYDRVQNPDYDGIGISIAPF